MKTILLFLILPLVYFSSSSATGQTVLLSDNFDDGNLTKNPAWSKFFEIDRITIDSSVRFSPPYSCKISTSNQRSAIETATRINSATMPFQISENVFIQSMGDEGIPLLLHGSSTVAVLFLLPNRLLQLDVLKSTSQWQTASISIPNGYTLGTWLNFTIDFNGNDSTALLVDGSFRGYVKQKFVDVPHTLQIGNMYLNHTSTFFVDDLRLTTSSPLPTPGEVYFVLCSDTGSWDGLDVNTPQIKLLFTLYSDPKRNAARVINTDFRSRLKDSRGNPLKFTWFMLDGSLNARNTNAETVHRWISNLEMMQKYRGDSVKAVGDELSFHYHTWIWNDPDQNGIYHWNQASRFSEYRDDFIETVGHIVLDGKIFPTSFRSGWHYMDNEWEAFLDGIIPYRLENTSPAKGTDVTEPIDNNYDWSRATLAWVPYHPDSSDYQMSGNLRGWETRCIYMKSVSTSTLVAAFSRAFSGEDQVVTIWSHLPESDFPEQIVRVDSLIKVASEYFPEVQYSYETATGAMKKWRKVHDDAPPGLAAIRHDVDGVITMTITSSEKLWQDAPLIFAQNSSGKVSLLKPESIKELQWKVSVKAGEYTLLAAAGSDEAGNAAIHTIDLLTREGTGSKDVPLTFSLGQAYPNPFNTMTIISYTLPLAGHVRLSLYSVTGELVLTLVDGEESEGNHSVSWNGSSAASGVYFYQLVAGRNSAVGKCLLLK